MDKILLDIFTYICRVLLIIFKTGIIMKIMLTMKEKIWGFVFCFGIFFPLICQAVVIPKSDSLVFKSSSILNSLLSKDVQSIYQDRDGYIWISTRNGLFQYDGQFSVLPLFFCPKHSVRYKCRSKGDVLYLPLHKKHYC